MRSVAQTLAYLLAKVLFTFYYAKHALQKVCTKSIQNILFAVIITILLFRD